jgi:RNA polymerase sigma factor (TIGR02999 family)
MQDVTRILTEVYAGNPHAAEQLLPLVYVHLRQLAAARMAQEKPGQTLQATALVHEAFLRLVDRTSPQAWRNRGHFFAAAAQAMRQILIDQARRKQAIRHGGERVRAEFHEGLAVDCVDAADAERILQVHEALTELEATAPRSAQLVQLRFFGGLTLDEAALASGISVASAKRDWAAARVWLYRRLSAG